MAWPAIEAIRTALTASLEVAPCAVCAFDIAATEFPVERTVNDLPCESCHLNWPTRIEIGGGVLEAREQRIG